MPSFGLKTNVAVNIALLLFIGMGLTAFMTTNLLQRLLIKSEMKRAILLTSTIERHIESLAYKGSAADDGFLTPEVISRMASNADIPCVCILLKDDEMVYLTGDDCDMEVSLKRNARQAMVAEKMSSSYYGKGWGVFWKQNQEMIVSAPLYDSKGITAGISVLMPLGSLFQQIRTAEQMIFLYIIINGVLLTLVGIYQISKSTVKPVQRILKKAQEYKGETGSLVFEEHSENEFKQLSNALNSLMGRISDDRKKLETSVTSLEYANEELKQAQRDVVRAEKLASVGRLSSGIAHEIGNPLGIVSGYLELIKSDDISGDQKTDFIQRAEKEIERIDKIIRQLLDYSRRSGKSDGYTHLNEVIQDVVEMLKVQPLFSGIDIKLNLTDSDDLIQGDSGQLRQIFLNLTMNAADAIAMTKESTPGRIEIITQHTSDDSMGIDLSGVMKVTVRDNGSGIPGNKVDSVFDPFFTTKDPGKGTGLGLSVCYTLIEDMGGTIHVESEEGVGTTFYLHLPFADTPDSVKPEH